MVLKSEVNPHFCAFLLSSGLSEVVSMTITTPCQAEYTYSENGDFKIVYEDSGVKGYDFTIYNKQQNKIYTKWRNIDTIFSYSASQNSLVLQSEKEGKEIIINGKKCKSFIVCAEEPQSKQEVKLTYYYPIKGVYLNPENYKNYKDFFLDRVISKTKAPFYKIDMNMTKYILIFEIEKIELKEIGQTDLSVPPNIPIKTK